MKKRILLTITAIATVLALTGCGEQRKYDKAMAQFEQGEYETAKTMFEQIAEYEDATAQIENIEKLQDYIDAENLFADGEYEQALSIYKSLESYEDSAEKANEIELLIAYNEAVDTYNMKEYENAKTMFEALVDYKDAKHYVECCNDFIAIQEAEDLLANGEYEAAIAKFTELEQLERANQATLSYAKALSDAGDDKAAYLQYTRVLEYEEAFTWCEAYRRANNKSKAKESFTDDYGTTFYINGVYGQDNETGMSMRFRRDDIVNAEMAYASDRYLFSNTMETEWKKMLKHVRLVLNGTEFYNVTANSGLPYCDLNGESGEKWRWYCWANFVVEENYIKSQDSAIIYYDDIPVYDFMGITPVSAKLNDYPSVYEKGMKYFEAGELYNAKIQFERLFNYQNSDTYLDLINTYYSYLLHKKIGYTNTATEEKNHIDELIAELGVKFAF